MMGFGTAEVLAEISFQTPSESNSISVGNCPEKTSVLFDNGNLLIFKVCGGKLLGRLRQRRKVYKFVIGVSGDCGKY